jgi:hypothetical protein
MNADTPLTQHFIGGANTALAIGTPAVASPNVTLTWSAVEGGTYSVDASPNQTTWTSKATGLVSTGTSKSATYATLGSSGTEYGRVNRTALATYDANGQTASTVAKSAVASYTLSTTPTVTIPTATAITTSGATLGGNVTSDGGTAITARGVVFSLTATNGNPQLGGNGVSNLIGSGTTGVFNVSATGLVSASAYTFRAYASNILGTTYSSAGTFTTLSTAFQTWQQTWYGSTTSNSAAFDASPYGTGVSNLLVFAFMGPNQNPATAALSQLPQSQLSGGNYFFSFTEPSGVSGITYSAEWRAMLESGAWSPIPDTGSGTLHTFSIPASGTQMFLRLKVTAP